MVNRDFWEGRRILVTGATGFLGSWLVQKLSELKSEIVIILRDDVPESYLFLSETDKKVIKVRGSLEDFFIILRVVNEYEIEYCFHLASQAIVPIANNQPLSTFESNIRGTYNLFEASRIYGKMKGIINVSSDKVYGEHKKLPLKEGFSLQGVHPYEVSKICSERIAISYCSTYSIPVVIPRFANIYGGGDLNWNRLIPGIIRDVLNDVNPRVRSSGTPIRDFIFIRDAVRALIILMENLEKMGLNGEIFNFGTGIPVRVIDVVNLIIDIAGAGHLKPDILASGDIKGEIKRQYLSIEKAKRFLGYSPEYSLKRGLEETIKWYRTYFRKE